MLHARLPRQAVLGLTLVLVASACGPTPSATAPSAEPSLSSQQPAGQGTPGATNSAASQAPGGSAALPRFTAAVLPVRLPSSISRAVAFSADGALLVCGGLLRNGATAPAIVRVDVAARTAAAVGSLAVAVHDAAGAALAAGDVVFGGGDQTALATIQRCAPTGAAVIGALPAPRADLSAVALSSGEALIVGGGTATNLPTAVLATGDGSHLRAVGALVLGVRYAAVAAVGETVLVCGGYRAGADVADIQAVDLATGRSRVIGHLPGPLAHAAAFAMGGFVVIAGGRRNGIAQSAIWLVDPSSGAVTRVGSLPSPLSDAAAVAVDEVVYLVGGEDASGQVDTIVAVRGS